MVVIIDANLVGDLREVTNDKVAPLVQHEPGMHCLPRFTWN